MDNDLAVYAEKYNNSNIIVTLSEFGVCGLSGSQYLYKSTGVDDVIDVTGAGDTCLAIIVYCYTMKLSLSTTLEMCNYFGEKAVKTVGNYNINKRDILEFQLKRIGKVIDNQVFIHNLIPFNELKELNEFNDLKELIEVILNQFVQLIQFVQFIQFIQLIQFIQVPTEWLFLILVINNI